MFVHDLVAAREQAIALRDAMAAAGLDFRIRFALKAQRDPDFLRFLRDEAPFVGMDVCSPGEIDWALEHGWAPRGDQLHRHERVGRATSTDLLPTGVHLNVDLLSQLERLGRRAARLDGRDPREPGHRCVDTSAGPRPCTPGSAPTKFGILPERLDDAVAIAAAHDLTIDTVHYHSGYLYMTESIPIVEEAARRVAGMVRDAPRLGLPDRAR